MQIFLTVVLHSKTKVVVCNHATIVLLIYFCGWPSPLFRFVSIVMAPVYNLLTSKLLTYTFFGFLGFPLC